MEENKNVNIENTEEIDQEQAQQCSQKQFHDYCLLARV